MWKLKKLSNDEIFKVMGTKSYQTFRKEAELKELIEKFLESNELVMEIDVEDDPLWKNCVGSRTMTYNVLYSFIKSQGLSDEVRASNKFGRLFLIRKKEAKSERTD